MNDDENEQKATIKDARIIFDTFIEELQRIEEDQKQIIAQTKLQGESKIKKAESIIDREEEDIKLFSYEMEKIEEYKKSLKKIDEAVQQVNNFMKSEKELFEELNISQPVSVIRPRYQLLDEEIAIYRSAIDVSKETIKRTNDDLQKFLETECTLNQTQKTETEESESDLIPKCEICLEKYDHSEHWQSAIIVCGHQFGKSCIEKWFLQSGRCPKCNRKFTLENILTLF